MIKSQLIFFTFQLIERYWKKKYSINADVFSVRDTLHAAIFHCVSTFMPCLSLERGVAVVTQDEKDTPDKNKCNQEPIQTYKAYLERKFMQRDKPNFILVYLTKQILMR